MLTRADCGKTSYQSTSIRAHTHTVGARGFPTKLNVAFRGLVEKMAEIAVVFVILSTISPSLSDNVISLTDVDFDDRVFSSSTHFVMFYGPW